MKILGRNVGLRNGYIELQFNCQHEIDHLQGAYPQVAELSIQGKWDGNSATGTQYGLYQRDQPIADPLLRLRLHYMTLRKKRYRSYRVAQDTEYIQGFTYVSEIESGVTK